MAATERRRSLRAKKPFLRKLPFLAAGLGALAARETRAQSNLDMRLLYYKESDGRTEVIDPVMLLHQELGDSYGALDLTLSYDAISGASPTGGYPTLDVTTSASGNLIQSGSFPQAQYKDHREAIAAAWSRKFGSHLPQVDLSWSKENDYLARGLGLSDSWTLFGGRGTLHAALSISRDVVTPVTTNVDHDKKTNGYSLGYTWILGERDLFDVSFSLLKLSGYLDDPYKIVQVGDPGAGQTLPEHRPDTRDRRTLVAKYGHYFSWDASLRGTYRFYDDSWKLQAHTLELDYAQHLGSDWILEPRVRWHTQSAASFYDSLFAAPQTYMSADYRLSPMDSILGEVALTWKFDERLSLNVSAGIQRQTGRDRVKPYAPARRDDGEGEGGGGSPSVSAADLDTTTITIGFSRSF